MSLVTSNVITRVSEFGLMSLGYEMSLKVSDSIFRIFSNKYRELTSNSQLYVVTNTNKSILMAYISYLFINIFIQNPQYIFDNAAIIPENSQIAWQRLTSLYAATDFIALLKSKKMPFSTKLHHYGVILAFVIVTLSKFNYGSLSKALVIYGAFSAMAGGVNTYLGFRKLLDPKSKSLFVLKKMALITYILACSGNWTWQLKYLLTYFKSKANYLTILKFLVNTGLLYAWIQDDLKLIRHLLTN